MWNTQDIRLLRSSSSQKFHRRFFWCIAWLLYGISRCCHFLKLRYNAQNKRLEQVQYHKIIGKLVLAIKCCLLLQQCASYLVYGFYVYIELFQVDEAAGQEFLIHLLVDCLTVYVLRRALIFLHCREDRMIIKQIVNEIISISSNIQNNFGMIYEGEIGLLALYMLKLYLVFILLDAMWHKHYFLWVNFFYWSLLEYCIFAYFSYQLILLNWYRNFAFFFQSFIEHHARQNVISRDYHRRLLQLFKLHLRVKKLHKCISEKIGWLPTANFLAIFTSIANMELLLECMAYAQGDIEDKIYIIADGCLGPALVPLLNVLILGLCTDRLRSEELSLQQQIVIINVTYVRRSFSLKQQLDNEHTSLIVHQKLEPLDNLIILGISCDREFAFGYFLTVILTAISFLQYSISLTKEIVECKTRK